MTSIVKIFPQRTNLQSPLKVDEKMQTFLSKIWMKKILIKGYIIKAYPKKSWGPPGPKPQKSWGPAINHGASGPRAPVNFEPCIHLFSMIFE